MSGSGFGVRVSNACVHGALWAVLGWVVWACVGGDNSFFCVKVLPRSRPQDRVN